MMELTNANLHGSTHRTFFKSLLDGSGGGCSAERQRGAAARDRTMRDWIAEAKLGGGFWSLQKPIRTTSSRGARGLDGPGRCVFRIPDLTL